MIYNNLGLNAGFLPHRRPIHTGIAPGPWPTAIQIGGINQGPGNDVFVGGNVTTSPLYIPVTEVTETPFTPTVSDYFLCVDIDGPSSIVLPANPVTGRVYVVKDCDGDASTNPITITATGSTIDGSANATINTDYGSLNFVFNGTEWSIY
jgi:hypothetical protein